MLTILCKQLCILFVYLMVGCGVESNESQLRRIIGNNDLTPVKDDRLIFNAVGLMQVGCTASHIGEGLVITAGHCLGGYTRIERARGCRFSDFDIRWGVTLKKPGGSSSSRCLKVVLRVNDGIQDYAVIKVFPHPQSFVRMVTREDSPRGSRISIFSHAGGRPLEWSGYCSILEFDATGPFYYTCDTEPGSSGAPVVNRDNDVIGIHAFETFDRNGGTMLSRTILNDLED